jgi:hypothetical protein
MSLSAPEAATPSPGRARWRAGEWAALAAAALFAFSLAFFRDADLDWHWYVGTGRWIVEHHAVPHTEPFSFTAAGTPYRAEHWLGEVLFYLIHSVGGVQALVTLKALLFAAMAAVLVAVGRGMISAGPAALIAALVAAASAPDQMALRLHVLTPAFALAELLLLERWRRTGRGLWLVVPLALLWINLHGSGPLAVAILGVYLVGEVLLSHRRERAKLLLLALLGAALATLITPYGWGLWLELLHQPLVREQHAVVREFLPLTRLPAWQWSLVGPVLLLVVAGLARSRSRGVSPGLALCVLGFFLMAFRAQRHLGLFLWPAALLIFQSLSSPPTEGKESRGLRGAWAVTVLLTVLSLLVLTDRPYLLFNSARRSGWTMVAGALPEEALDAMRALAPPGNLFNTYENGGLVIERAPEFKVFIDNRYRPYGDLLRDYGTVAQAAPGWQQVLDRWQINTCLVDPGRLDLIAALHASPLWSLAVLTGDGAVFVRRPTAIPEVDVASAIGDWRARHPPPRARWPWQADPWPRERVQLAAMASALGVVDRER